MRGVSWLDLTPVNHPTRVQLHHVDFRAQYIDLFPPATFVTTRSPLPVLFEFFFYDFDTAAVLNHKKTKFVFVTLFI